MTSLRPYSSFDRLRAVCLAATLPLVLLGACSDPGTAPPDGPPADGGADGPGPGTPDGGGGATTPVLSPEGNVFVAPTCAAPQEGSCRTLTAVTQTDLAATLAKAGTGDCLQLGPGSHGDVEVPEGVTLLGPTDGSPLDAVELGAVKLAKGSRLACLGASAVEVAEGATEVVVERVVVDGAGREGVLIGSGAAVVVQSSVVRAASLYGIYLGGSGSVAIRDTAVVDGSGPGLAVVCDSGCSGATLTVDGLLLMMNQLAGLALMGEVEATLKDTRIVGTQPRSFDGGLGLSIGGGSRVQATGLRVEDSSSGGVLVEGTLEAVAEGEAASLELRRNRVGMTVRNGAQVTVSGAVIESNQGVGVALGDATSRLTISDSEICRTELTPLPALVNGMAAQADFGQGLAWSGGATAEVTGVRFCDNDQASVVISGEVGEGSRLEDLTFEGKDAGRTQIVIQLLPDGGRTPQIVGDATTSTQADQALPAL